MLHIVDFNGRVRITIMCDGVDCDVSAPSCSAKDQQDRLAKSEALGQAFNMGFVQIKTNGRTRHYCRDCQ